MKRLFLLSLILAFVFNNSFTQSFCGVFSPNQASGSNPDSIYYDRFGNSYDLIDPALASIPDPVTVGYFDIIYDGGSTWEDSMQTVIEQVFLDATNLITKRTDSDWCEQPRDEQINILLSQFSSNNSVLASASNYIYEGYDQHSCDLVLLDDNIYRKLNTSLLVQSNCEEFSSIMDGEIRINSFHNDDFHKSLAPLTDTTKYDLYTVLLHEMGHLLGFTSFRWTEDVSPGDNKGDESEFMSNWDRQLYRVANYSNIQSGSESQLFYNTVCDTNCWVKYSTSLDNLANSDCSDTTVADIVFGSNGLAPINHVSTSTDLENILSHLNEDCFGSSLLMHPSLDLGTMKRSFSDTEKDIICKLGLTVTNYCTGEFPLVVNDETQVLAAMPYSFGCFAYDWSVCPEEEFVIDFDELLANDSDHTSNINMSISNVEVSFYNVITEQENSIDTIYIDDLNRKIHITFNDTIDPLVKAFDFIYDVKDTYTDCNIRTTSFRLNLALCNEDCLEDCDNLTCLDIQAINNKPQQTFTEINDLAIAYEQGDLCSRREPRIQFCKDFDTKYAIMDFEKTSFPIALEKSVPKGCNIIIDLSVLGVHEECEISFFGSTEAPCRAYNTLMPFGTGIDIPCAGELPEYPPHIYHPYGLMGTIDGGSEILASFIVEDWVAYEGDCVDNLDFSDIRIELVDIPDDINYLVLNKLSDEPGLLRIKDVVITMDCSKATFSLEQIDCNEYKFVPDLLVSTNTYSWDLGDGTTSNLDSIDAHGYSLDVLYDIKLMVTDSCGNVDSTSQEIFVECPDFCDMGGESGVIYINAYERSNLSDWIDPGTFLDNDTSNNETIAVKGRLIMDVDYTFINCHFVFSAGAELVKSEDKEITIVFSTLEGCDKLWKGIKVEGNGVFVFLHDSIRDAEFAINLQDESVFRNSSNIYDKNYVGIYSNPISGTNKYLGSPIVASSFTCTENLLPHYDSLATIDNRTLAGIFINSLDLLMVQKSIIGTDTSANIFNGLQNGILANASNLVCSDAIFTNMIGTNDNGGQIDDRIEGYGIALNNRVTAKIVDNEFSDGNIGISATTCHLSNIYLGGNSFTSSSSKPFFSKGIDLRFNHGADIQVANNTMDNTNATSNSRKIGINVHSLFITDLEINGNEFETNGTGFNSLRLNQVQNIGHSLIRDNTVTQLNASGNVSPEFLIENCNNLSIDNNIFNIAGTSNFSSQKITVHNVVNSHFRENELFLGNEPQGIQVVNSPSNLYCCNKINSGSRGFAFFGENEMTSFSTNSMDGNTRGLVLYEAIIGEQRHRGNIWPDTTSSFAEIISPSGEENDIALRSIFRYDQDEDFVRPVDVIPSSIEDDWFVDNDIPETPNCTTALDCGIAPWMLDPDGDGSELIPSDTISDFCDYYDGLVDILTSSVLEGEFEDQNQWTRDFYLYLILSHLPTEHWKQCDSLSIFYDNHETVYEYVSVFNQFLDLYGLSEGQAQSHDTHDLLLRSRLDSIRLIYDDIDYSDTLWYEVDLDGLDDMVVNLHSNVSAIMQLFGSVNYNALYKTKLMRNDIDNLPEDLYFHTNLKMIWKERVLTFEYPFYSPTPGTLTSLDSIADKCPLDYGQAVFESRGFLDNHGNYDFEDVETLCFSGQSKLSRVSEIETKQSISVYPNPNRGLFTIKRNATQEEDLVIRVYSSIGQPIYSGVLNNNAISKKIDLGNVDSGIYIIEFVSEGKVIQTSKLVVH